MQLRDYIEEGAKKAGSLTALGRQLGISQPDMSNAKAMKKPLPVKAIVQMADYIGADLKAVIAANELVTEKDEAKRAFWSPFVEHAKAASFAAVLALVTNFATPSPANTDQINMTSGDGLYYVKLAMLRAWLKQRQLHRFIEFLKELLIPTRTLQIA